MDEEICAAIVGRGPVRLQPLGVDTHPIHDPEDVSGRVSNLQVVPGASLRSGDGCPISPSELPERVAVHGPNPITRLASLSSTESRVVAPARAVSGSPARQVHERRAASLVGRADARRERHARVRDVEWWPAVVFGWPTVFGAVLLALAGAAKGRPGWLIAAAVICGPFFLYLAGHPGARWFLAGPLLPLFGAFAIARGWTALAWAAVVVLCLAIVWVMALLI